MRQIQDPSIEWNVNADCKEYIYKHNLANKQFAEFFFNFHEPLTLAFLRRLKTQLGNGMQLCKKFQYVADEISNLLHLAYVELDGLDISCSAFGGDAICIKRTGSPYSDCEDSANIFFVMMNDEYRMELGLFEKILDVAMKYLKKIDKKVLMIVDYRNMEQTDYTFGPRARARYEKCKDSVEQVYFYHWKAGLNFGNEFDGLEPYLIPDKAGLKRVIKAWKKDKTLITF